MTIKCEYCKIADGYGDLIHETDYWMIFLAPSQRYLGTCVVVLKRNCRDLSGLEKREWIDFGLTVERLENSVAKSFNPSLYNWSCFKNSVFRYENPNPEIHWHFIPRYKSEVEFGGLKFDDPDFGYIPKPIERIIPKEVMEKIKLKIKKNL
jgi:Diadenosine tetraphosphate (Ap4A) hydrolase and other HIT family hydrolases